MMRDLQLLVMVTVTVMTLATVGAAAPRSTETLSAPSVPLTDPSETSEQSPLERGWRAYQRGELAAALTAYREAVEASPADASLWYDLGCLYALTQDAGMARAALEHALMLNPYLAAAHDALGQLDEQAGDLDGARLSYINATRLDSRTAKFSRHLIRMRLRLDEPDAAREALQQLLRIAPDDVDARYQLGILELRANAPDLAINEFQRILAHTPSHVLAWNGLGLAYLRIGALDQASEALEHAKSLDPNNAVTQTNLGVVAAHQERWDEARQAWKRALDLQPRYGPATQNLELIDTPTTSSNP